MSCIFQQDRFQAFSRNLAECIFFWTDSIIQRKLTRFSLPPPADPDESKRQHPDRKDYRQNGKRVFIQEIAGCREQTESETALYNRLFLRFIFVKTGPGERVIGIYRNVDLFYDFELCIKISTGCLPQPNRHERDEKGHGDGDVFFVFHGYLP